MKISFEKRLILFFTFIFLAIIILGIVASWNNRTTLETNKRIAHNKAVIAESELILSLSKDIVMGSQRYVITGDSSFLSFFPSSKNIVFDHIRKLKDLTRDNPMQQRRVDSLNFLIKNRISFSDLYIRIRNENGMEAASRLISTGRGKFYVDEIRDLIAQIEGTENLLLIQREDENNTSIARFNLAFYALLVSVFLFLAIVFFYIRDNFKQRAKAEQEIKEANTFLNTVLENIPNMIFVKDARELRFVRFNKAGEDLLGYSRKDLIGKNDYDFFPKEQADFFTGKDKDVINKGILLDIPEEPINTASGERLLHTKKIPVADEHGNPLYLIGISEDITEQKNAEQHLNLLNTVLKKNVEQLEALNKELEAFTYSVSHDLRAPLRIIDGYAGILAADYKDKLDAEGIKTIHVIRNSARKMGQLIDDLLNLSRLGRKELTVNNVSMQELVQSVIKEQLAEHPDRIEIKTGTLDAAHCDKNLMQQVWSNLIANAIKYSANSAKTIIEIGSYKKDNEIIYYIKDNGVGFDMKYAGKLFGVFQRLHKMTEFEGTGVGLAIVHRIISKHGGKVWADAQINKGATFYFSLPA